MLACGEHWRALSVQLRQAITAEYASHGESERLRGLHQFAAEEWRHT